MFNKFTENIGNSIKKIAKAVYVIQVVISVITLVTAIIFFFQFCDDGDEEFLIYMVVCLCAFLVSVMSALLSIALLYGFGELISTNKFIADKLNLKKCDSDRYLSNIEDIVSSIYKLKKLDFDNSDLKKEENKNIAKKTKKEESNLTDQDVMNTVLDKFRELYY